jgi:hypothetical protein
MEAAMNPVEERAREIDAAVADIRRIEGTVGVTRESLERIKQRLIKLAARTDLFDQSAFPPPAPGGKRNSCLYRLPRIPSTVSRCMRIHPAACTARRRTTTPRGRDRRGDRRRGEPVL